MNDAALMSVVNCPGDGGHQSRCTFLQICNLQFAICNDLSQIGSIYQFHRKVVLTFVLADFVNRHDVGVIEIGRRLGLGAKTLHVGSGGELAGQDHLESYDAIEADLPRFVDDAHAAAGKLLDQLVVAKVPQPRTRRTRSFIGPDGGFTNLRLVHRVGKTIHLLLVGEECTQIVSQRGMPPQQFLMIGLLAGVDVLQIGVQDRFQLSFA